MVRQCAWCLHVINNSGEHISASPVPKIYEATHGMCKVCGASWLENALQTMDKQQSLLGASPLNNLSTCCVLR